MLTDAAWAAAAAAVLQRVCVANLLQAAACGSQHTPCMTSWSLVVPRLAGLAFSGVAVRGPRARLGPGRADMQIRISCSASALSCLGAARRSLQTLPGGGDGSNCKAALARCVLRMKADLQLPSLPVMHLGDTSRSRIIY